VQFRLHFLALRATQANLHNTILAKDKTRILFQLLSQILQQAIPHVLNLENEYIWVFAHAEPNVVHNALFPSQTLAVGFGQGN